MNGCTLASTRSRSVPPTAILEQLTRYASRRRNDPAEDRATAVLASLLSADPRFSEALSESWGIDPITTAEVIAQRPVKIDGRTHFIDLELRGPEHLVWVEVKYTARLSGPGQLSRYQRALHGSEHPETHKHLVLLVPAWRLSSFRDYGYAPATSREPWNRSPRIATWNQALLALRSAKTARRSASWFLNEALLFFAGMDLTPSPPLKVADVQALARIHGAEEAIDGLLNEVQEIIERDYGRVRALPPEDQAYREFWVPSRIRRKWAEGSSFTFGVDRGKCFAGLRLKRGRTEDLPQLAQFRTAGWEFSRSELWLTRDLKAIAQASEQADEFVRFIRDVFDRIKSGPLSRERPDGGGEERRLRAWAGCPHGQGSSGNDARARGVPR